MGFGGNDPCSKSFEPPIWNWAWPAIENQSIWFDYFVYFYNVKAFNSSYAYRLCSPRLAYWMEVRFRLIQHENEFSVASEKDISFVRVTWAARMELCLSVLPNQYYHICTRRVICNFGVNCKHLESGWIARAAKYFKDQPLKPSKIASDDGLISDILFFHFEMKEILKAIRTPMNRQPNRFSKFKIRLTN